MKNFVSIIVPCYNQAQYLDEALQSVLDQTYQDWECIIVNDGSPDNTEEVAEKWIEKDNRFVYFYKENGGLSSARNLGLERAKGEYIQFLDSDDYICPKKIELSILKFKEKSNVNKKVVITNFKMFVDNVNTTYLGYWSLKNINFNFESFLYKWDETFAVPIHCGMFEAGAFKSFRFPENLKAKEDWIMWVSVFKDNYTAIFIDEYLALYRLNPNGSIGQKDMSEDIIKAFDYFQDKLSAEEINKLSTVLFKRYIYSNKLLKDKINKITISNTYRTGNFIKKIIKKIGLLNTAKKIVSFVKKSSNFK